MSAPMEVPSFGGPLPPSSEAAQAAGGMHREPREESPLTTQTYPPPSHSSDSGTRTPPRPPPPSSSGVPASSASAPSTRGGQFPGFGAAPVPASSAPPASAAAARPAMARHPPLGVYHFTLPVRPVRADISIQHLEKLSSYYGLYGALLWAPGAAVVLLTLLTSIPAQQIFGWALMVAGVVTALQFIVLMGAPGAWSFLLLALLHFAVGFWLATSALYASVGYIIILIFWLLFQGVVKVALSVSVSSISSWPLTLLSGLLSLALAFAVLSLEPTKESNWLVALVVGGDFAFTGLALMLVSLFASWALLMVSETEEPLIAATHGSHV